MKLSDIDQKLMEMIPAAAGTLNPLAQTQATSRSDVQAVNNQMKQKQLQKKAIQDEINLLTKQIAELRRQMASIR